MVSVFIKIPTNNNFAKRIEENTKRYWLNCEIKLLYSKQTDLELQALELHLLIIKNMDGYDYELFNERFEKMISVIKHKHNQKIQRLNKKLRSMFKK